MIRPPSGRIHLKVATRLCAPSSARSRGSQIHALHLPREERAFLAEKLLESLDCEEAFPASKEWMDEIHQRCQEIDDGKVKLIPAKEIFGELDKEFE